jgi:hypothetical protein
MNSKIFNYKPHIVLERLLKNKFRTFDFGKTLNNNTVMRAFTNGSVENPL